MRIHFRAFFILAILVFAPARALADNFPVISSNVATGIATPGSQVTLTATTGYVPLKYIWRHNGVVMPDVTGAVLTLNGITLQDAGVYMVQTQLDPFTTYSSMEFDVPVIGSAPVPGDRCWIMPSKLIFEPGSNLFLVVRPDGLSSHDNVQWYKDGVIIPGAGQLYYSISPLTAADAGSYTAVANGNTSSVALVVLNKTLPQFTLQPVSTDAILGGSASFYTFCDLPASNFVDSIQWYKDGVAIPGATSVQLNIANVTAGDFGNYVVKATNAAGTTSSQVAALWPFSPPTIIKQPAQQVIPLDGTIQLSVEASGPTTILPLSYQWQKEGVDLPGATGSTLMISHAQESDAAYYSVDVSGSRGRTSSIRVPVSVGFKSPTVGGLSILYQPQSISAGVGTDVTLSISVSGSGPISYQWSKDAIVVPGATNSSLTLHAVTTIDAGSYKVVATNNQSSVASQAALVTVTASTPLPSYSKPVITLQPISRTVPLGADVTLTFDFTSDTTALIQWYKGGVPIPAATTKSITLHNVQPSDVANYTGEALNANGATRTAVASLAIQSAPLIRTQPSDTTVTAGDNLILDVLGYGTPEPTYQWYKADVALVGATGTSLLIAGATADAAGTYHVVLSNVGGTVTSNSVKVTMLARSTLTGTYFGKFGSDSKGGEFALVVRSNGSCMLIGYLTGQKAGIVAEFTIAPDGSFDVFATTYLLQQLSPTSSSVGYAMASDVLSTFASPAGYAIQGKIQSSAVLGQISDLSLSLTGNATSDSGLATAYAGAYSASGADASNHTLYSIVGADGRIMILDTAATGANSGVGTISSLGVFSVPTGNGKTVAGGITNNSLTGKVSDAGGNTTTFLGGSDSAIKAVRLTNISTRGYTGAGADVIIAGFVVQGVATHRVLIRAIGPGLAAYNVSGVLSSPIVQIYQNSTKVAEATMGGDAPAVIAATQQLGTFPIAPNMKDVALVQDLDPGAYTVQVRNTNGDNGIVLVEIYDASGSSSADTKLINVSTRGRVGTGDQQMIVGFIVAGSAPKKVLVRAIGPTLAQFNVTGLLANPRIDVHDAHGIVATNDDWNNAPDVVAAMTKLNVFPLAPNSKDAALVLTLAPGPYTVVVSGADGGSGNALVEVYEYNEL